MRAMVLWTINDILIEVVCLGGVGKRLLPYGLQQYLPDEVAKPIIELCSFFKKICSIALMEDAMLKAEQAKPEGSTVEGYVAEEALTFSSHYFWDVTTKFNRPDRNVDPPPPTCQFQVFRSLCKLIGLRLVIRFDAQELKKVIWYVLHNSPEIDTYRSQFKSKFPNKDMKEEFPHWFWSQINLDLFCAPNCVSTTSELFALAYGPTPTPISVNSCVANGMRFIVYSRDKRRTTQNNGICSPGGKDREMYYGQLKKPLRFRIFRSKLCCSELSGEAFKDDQYILATQVKQCFYLEDMARRQPHWNVVEHVNHKKFSDGGVIVVEEDPDVIHFDNSSDLPLSTSFNDLDNATLHIDGQSTKVDAPPDIIDLDEDDDIIDDKDALPHDLADSDDEDLVNVDDDDDGVDIVYSDVARGHDDDDGGDDRPLHTIYPPVAGVASLTDKITDDKGPVPIRFEWDDKKNLMPLGDHASHWSNSLGVLIREMPLYYPSWQKVSAERKAAILTKIGIQFDLTPHMQSQRWTYINAGIQQHLQKLYNTSKASLKAAHWVINPETGTAQSLENPSLIHTFFMTHTVNGVFMQDEDRAIYEEMLRLQALGSNTPSGVPYTEEEINALARKGKQRGNLSGDGRVLPERATNVLIPPPPQCMHNSDDYESTPEFGNASGSGGCEDDEMANDEDGDEDEEDEEYGDS
uniref:DUF4218 domain-containing protein n=1 Tax=Tanacetum cinerariifolium TaxID=118510 RepID=A0A6L2K956_TANCI|nr:hypothetical protein [Tanacetum cinerariifolium]